MEKDRIRFRKGKQRELLFVTEQKLKMNQREFSNLLGINRRTLRNWLSERNLLPLWAYDILKEKFPNSISYEKFITEKLNRNWGSVKGGKRTYLKMVKKYGKENICEIMKNIRSKKQIKRKINLGFSPSKYTIFLLKNKISTLPLLATLLMTDGNIYENQITYGTIDLSLRNTFVDLCKLNDVSCVSEYRKNDFMKLYCGDKILLKKLYEISSSYKKSPNRVQTKKEYLKEPQPSIKYLFNSEENVIKECLRLAMSSDGNITIGIRKENDKVKLKPQITLSCAHPILCKEWLQLFNKFGIKMKLQKSKNVWSGIRGIGTESFNSIKKFQEIGGFIEGVKISKKSKRLSGIEKNKALSFILLKKEIRNEKELLNDLEPGS
jgi:hypothetical protein